MTDEKKDGLRSGEASLECRSCDDPELSPRSPDEMKHCAGCYAVLEGERDALAAAVRDACEAWACDPDGDATRAFMNKLAGVATAGAVVLRRERDQPGESAEALSVDCASPAVVQPAPSGSPTDGTTSRAAPNASVERPACDCWKTNSACICWMKKSADSSRAARAAWDVALNDLAYPFSSREDWRRYVEILRRETIEECVAAFLETNTDDPCEIEAAIRRVGQFTRPAGEP